MKTVCQIRVVWKKCHSESAAPFDRLSDRVGDEKTIFLPTGDSSHLTPAWDKLRLMLLFKICKTTIKLVNAIVNCNTFLKEFFVFGRGDFCLATPNGEK